MAKHKDVLEAERRIREAIETGADQLDISGLTGVTSLSDLDVDIANATSVKTLDLSNTQITDLSPIVGLNGITTLNLSGTQVADLSPIAGLNRITTLNLSGTQVADLSPIAGLNAITTLNLSRTQVADLSLIAGLNAITTLYLNYTQVADLSPIAGLNAITTLHLDNTQVADLSPIAGLNVITSLSLAGMKPRDFNVLSALPQLIDLYLEDSSFSDLSLLPQSAPFETLHLQDSQVADLRALLDLTFAENQELFGLRFSDTPATATDPRLAEVAEVNGNEERLEAVLNYLKEGSPVEIEEDTPKQAPILGVSTSDGKIDLDRISPDALDALKKALHARLKKSSTDLSKAAGNQFPRLCEAARTVLTDVEADYDDLDLITLFLDGEILKDWMEAGREDGMEFPEEIAIPLASTNRDITGLTLGDPQVDILAERLDRAKSQPVPADEVTTHQQMSQAIQSDPESMGPDIRRVEEKLDQLSERVAVETRKPMHQNVLWAIASLAGSVPALAVQGIGVEVLSLEIKTFAAQNWPIIAATAESFGLRFANWFASSCAQTPELAEYAKAMLRRGTDKSEPDDTIH